MGTDPRTRVTDPDGRVWGHPNLRVIDGSLHVTNGGVNPVLTIFANAFRIMHDWGRPPTEVGGRRATPVGRAGRRRARSLAGWTHAPSCAT